MNPSSPIGPPFESPVWLTCECCGSTDDETTNGYVDVEGNYVNLCETCITTLSIEVRDVE